MRDTVNGLFGTIGLALAAARLFVPAESAHLGETLWIVQLWLLAAAVWLLLSLRHAGLARRLDRADLAVWLLAVGHIISALVVVATAGQKRAALNMAWEWGGVALAVTMLRQWLRSGRGWRRLYHLVAVAGVVLGGLGIWQFAAWYPSYRALLTELIAYERSGDQTALNSAELDRVRELRQELGLVGAEQDPVARAVLRQRLLASTEPIGRFALANTLAGVLAASLVLLCGILWSARQRGGSRLQLMTLGAAALIVGYCLVLTKSRTAWLGVLGACGFWGVLASRGRIQIGSATRWIAAGAASLGILAGLAWWSGALDRLVISETPKSLKYRLEYWTGTWGVIREAPLLGVGGTGNFRQHYLRHKLPGSSEEVLDPHNFVLDVWANGGVVGLLGMLFVLGILAGRVRRLASQRDSPVAATTQEPFQPGSPRGGAGWTGVLGIILLLLQEWALQATFDTQLAWLLAGWVGAAWLLPGDAPPAAAILASAVAWLVHLLGAGGIAMPAVSTLLLLLALGPAESADAQLSLEGTLRPRSHGRWAYIGRLAAMLVAGAGAFLIPSVSVSLARTYVAAGESLLSQRGDPAEARRYFQQATHDDPLDPQAWNDLAQLDHAASLGNGAESAAAFQSAIANLNRAIERDPYAPKLRWTAAQWLLDRFRKTGDPALAHDALKYAQSAAMNYPNDSHIRGTLAEAYAAVEEAPAAAREAGRALQLDQLNRNLGHYDRLLSDPTIERLKTLAASAVGGNGA